MHQKFLTKSVTFRNGKYIYIYITVFSLIQRLEHNRMLSKSQKLTRVTMVSLENVVLSEEGQSPNARVIIPLHFSRGRESSGGTDDHEDS